MGLDQKLICRNRWNFDATMTHFCPGRGHYFSTTTPLFPKKMQLYNHSSSLPPISNRQPTACCPYSRVASMSLPSLLVYKLPPVLLFPPLRIVLYHNRMAYTHTVNNPPKGLHMPFEDLAHLRQGIFRRFSSSLMQLHHGRILVSSSSVDLEYRH